MDSLENQLLDNSLPESVPPIQPRVRKNIPGWIRVLILFPLYFIVVGGFQFLSSLVLETSIFNEKPLLFHIAVSYAFTLAGTTLLLYFLMRVIDLEPFINLGFHTKGRLPDLLIGIIAGFIFMVAGFAILYATGHLSVNKVIFDFADFTLLFLLFVFVAFAEEMLLRGYVLKNLMLSMNKYVALALSSFMFSIMHALNPNFSWLSFLSIFLAGIALGATYIYTKNLWFPIAFHFSWNFFQSIMGFNVSGMDMYSVVETTVSMENEKISGGAFGFEGSMLALFFEIVVIVCVVVYYKRKEKLNKA